MPIFTNEIAKRCARWILLDTSPAPLPMLHPVRDDMAAAADEIRRLEGEVKDRTTERDYHLRMADKLAEKLHCKNCKGSLGELCGTCREMGCT